MAGGACFAAQVPLGQLRFFRRASGRLRGLAQGGFAGLSASAAGLTVTHYDEKAEPVHVHTLPQRSAAVREAAAAARRADEEARNASGECAASSTA